MSRKFDYDEHIEDEDVDSEDAEEERTRSNGLKAECAGDDDEPVSRKRAPGEKEHIPAPRNGRRQHYRA